MIRNKTELIHQKSQFDNNCWINAPKIGIGPIVVRPGQNALLGQVLPHGVRDAQIAVRQPSHAKLVPAHQPHKPVILSGAAEPQCENRKRVIVPVDDQLARTD